MKLFKLIALVALTLSVGAQSAKAELGRATSVEEVTSGSFLCEITGKVVKYKVADAGKAAASDYRASESGGSATGSVRTGQ